VAARRPHSRHITTVPIPQKTDVVVATTIFDGKVVFERK